MFIEVKEYGAKIGIDGGKLVVTKDGAELAQFPLGLIESAVVHTSVQISSQAVAALSRKGVKITWVNMADEIVCCTSADNPRYCTRRKGLYRMADDKAASLNISKIVFRTSSSSTLISMISL